MARTLIDLDDEALKAAMAALGTTTKVATVNAALRRIAEQAARDDALRREIERSGMYAALADRDQLWR